MDGDGDVVACSSRANDLLATVRAPFGRDGKATDAFEGEPSTVTLADALG